MGISGIETLNPIPMKTFKTILSLVLVTWMLSTQVSVAQTQDAWTLMQQFKGKWSGSAQITFGEASFTVVYHLNFKSSASGSALTMDEWFSHPDLGDFRGANLIGFNPVDGMIHWFSVDNMGTTHDHSGSWVTPQHFHMVHSSIQDGKPFVEVIDLRFLAGNLLEVKLTATLDGQVIQVVEGTLQRGNQQ